MREIDRERDESRTNRCDDGEADGLRQRRVGHKPARLSDAPHHPRQDRRQDCLGVDAGSVAHVHTVQDKVGGARSKDPAEMTEHVVETYNTEVNRFRRILFCMFAQDEIIVFVYVNMPNPLH